MIQKNHLRGKLIASRCGVLDDQRAAQLVEFAVSLPLLVLFVVGIFDFSGAFTLKQKLTNVTRDAARVAAAGPSNDLGSAFTSGSAPASVVDAFNVVDNYLAANQMNDCGVKASNVSSAGNLTWQYQVNPSIGSPCGITLIINRGYMFPMVGGTVPSATCSSQTIGSQTAVVATCISLQYTYPWKFGHVVSLLGSTTTLPSQISAVAVALNEN